MSCPSLGPSAHVTTLSSLIYLGFGITVFLLLGQLPVKANPPHIIFFIYNLSESLFWQMFPFGLFLSLFNRNILITIWSSIFKMVKLSVTILFFTIVFQSICAKKSVCKESPYCQSVRVHHNRDICVVPSINHLPSLWSSRRVGDGHYHHFAWFL